MPQTCCVTKCKIRYDKTSKVSFHCFPNQEARRKLWLNALGLENLNWNAKPRVCSNHFGKDDFIIGGNVRKLRKNAIPNTPRLISDDTEDDELRDELPSHPEARMSSSMDTEHSTARKSVPRDPLKEVSMSWSNERGTSSSEGNTELNVFTGVYTSPPKKRRQADGLLKTHILSTARKVCKEPEKKAADHSLLNISWISPNDTAEDRFTTSTPTKERRNPHSQILASDDSIMRNETSDGVELGTSTCSCSKIIHTLENEITYLKERNELLQEATRPKAVFSLEKFSGDNKKILYYTGFQTYEILMVVFKWILPSGDVKDIAIHVDAEKPVRQHLNKLTVKDQFFLTLIRLRRGTEVETLGDMFSISKSSVDNIFLCWINLMYLRLGCLDIWPNRDVLINRAPESMKTKYQNIIGSLDCTEFFIQRPSSLEKQSQCYSNYKGATTLKSLIMIGPAGSIIYASPLFTGSISDKGIIESSGFMDILKEKVDQGQILPGDIILADKGFNVVDLFKTVNVNINIPVFRMSGTQFTAEEVATTREIAQERIHVERAICRLKNYKILSSTIPIASLGTMQQIYTVCISLCNFRYGLIQEYAEE